MSLQQAAKYLQSKGRGDDSVLVHMTPKEVNSLQAVAKAHGGSLTVNPHTGLTEAGFLSDIMPMVVGAGLAAATGGTSLALTPGLIGLGVGGVQALRTGDINKGIMAGLGAYGGAGMLGGLASMGTGEISKAAGAGLADEQAQAAISDKLAQSSLGDKLSAGIGSAIDNPTGALQSLGGGSGWKGAGMLAAAAAPALLGQGQAPSMEGPTGGPNPYKYTYDAGVANPFPAANAKGVENNYFPGARYVRQPTSALAGGGLSDVAQSTEPVMYAAGGGEAYSLGDYSDGGRLLRGPGDGVSDSIPASIADKRPARLADGEFVVPARIVSELGNGSTEAGARKLYAMMDRVQKARAKTVGKGNIAKNSRADKHLPA